MNVSMSALRKPLALAAVTAVMFSAVACSGADPTSAPPPASNTSASEPAAEPTPTTSALTDRIPIRDAECQVDDERPGQRRAAGGGRARLERGIQGHGRLD